MLLAEMSADSLHTMDGNGPKVGALPASPHSDRYWIHGVWPYPIPPSAREGLGNSFIMAPIQRKGRSVPHSRSGEQTGRGSFILDSKIALSVIFILTRPKGKNQANVEDCTFGGFPLVQIGAAGHHFA